MSGSDPWAAFPVAPEAAADPFAAFPEAPPEATAQLATGPASQWVPNAVVRGMGNVVGTPHTLTSLIGGGAAGLARGVGAGAEMVGAPGVAEGARAYGGILDRGTERATARMMSGDEATQGLRTQLSRMGVNVPDVTAESGLGRVAQDAIAGATTFALTPGLAGVGGLAGNAGLGALSGASSGTVREAGGGPVAQAAAGIVAPVGVMGAAALASNRSAIKGAEEALRGLSSEQRQRIAVEVPRLMEQGQAAGVPITWAEAVQRTLGQTVPELDAIQGVATSSRGGGPVMSQMDVQGMTNARRALTETRDAMDPGASRQAGGRPQQFRAGTAISREADAEITGIKGVEDDVAAASFQAAEQRVMSDPAVRTRIQAIANQNLTALQQIAQANPLLQPHVERLAAPLRGSTNWTEFTAARSDLMKLLDGKSAEGQPLIQINVARQVKPIVERMTNNIDAIVPEYAQGRREYAQLMQNVVEPLRNGTLGRLAETTDLRQQSKMLRDNPIPGETGQVMRRLGGQQAQRNVVDMEAPALARSLLHRELEDRLEPILKARGPSPEAFANMTPTQRDNLRQMFQAQPGGDKAWQGFNRMLETLEAVRYRPRTGSRSEAATQAMADQVQTGPVRAVTNPIGWWGDLSRRLTMDLNTRAIANNLMSPEGYARLQALSSVRNPRVQAALVRSILASGQADDEGAP